MQQQQTIFLDQIVTCNEKWLLYDNQWQPAQWLNREEVHKHFPKLNLLHPQKKGSSYWHSAAGLIHYSFLNPGEAMISDKKAQQTDEMHQKLQHLQPALANRKGPILLQNTPHCMSHSQSFRVEQIGL